MHFFGVRGDHKPAIKHNVNLSKDVYVKQWQVLASSGRYKLFVAGTSRNGLFQEKLMFASFS